MVAGNKRDIRPSTVFYTTPWGNTRHLACWERLGSDPIREGWERSAGPCPACQDIIKHVNFPEERRAAIEVTERLAKALRRASRAAFDLAKDYVCKSGQWTVSRQELRDHSAGPCKRFEESWVAAQEASAKRWSPQAFPYLDGDPPFEGWRPVAPILPVEVPSFGETVQLEDLLRTAGGLARLACAYEHDVKVRREMCLWGRWDTTDYLVAAAVRSKVGWQALAEELLRHRLKITTLTKEQTSEAADMAGNWRRRADAIKKKHPDWLRPT